MIVNANSIVQHVIHIKNGIIKHHHKCKKYYSWNHKISVCENRKYLKSIAHTSVIKRDEIIILVNIVTTKITNTIAKILRVLLQ